MKAQSPVQVPGNDNELKPTASFSFCLDTGETVERGKGGGLVTRETQRLEA